MPRGGVRQDVEPMGQGEVSTALVSEPPFELGSAQEGAWSPCALRSEERLRWPMRFSSWVEKARKAFSEVAYDPVPKEESLEADPERGEAGDTAWLHGGPGQLDVVEGGQPHLQVGGLGGWRGEAELGEGAHAFPLRAESRVRSIWSRRLVAGCRKGEERGPGSVWI